MARLTTATDSHSTTGKAGDLLRLLTLLPLACLIGCAPTIDMERVACDTAGTAAYATLVDDAAPTPAPNPDIPPPPTGGKVSGDVSPSRLTITPAGLRHEIERPLVEEPEQIAAIEPMPVAAAPVELPPTTPAGPPVKKRVAPVPKPLPPRVPVTVYRRPAPSPSPPPVFRRGLFGRRR
jgi:hypothetical protein